MSSESLTREQWHGYYNRAAWKRLRKHQLAKNPLCKYCEANGTLKLAEVADHIIAHKGNLDLFLDPENLQSLCFSCHNSVKKREESGKGIVGGFADGTPIDPSHHWNSK